ncbi:hypothetical protein Tco_0826216 [Tanacetum coccineum]|uniref:Uncharacterized protein n=1 Tax=Tanacetum coccineum TaxID=301880 RepID=A0ABQ5AK53_9ASTR
MKKSYSIYREAMGLGCVSSVRGLRSALQNHLAVIDYFKVKVVVPNPVSDDGFVKVTRKHGKGKQNGKPRQIDGVRLTKPKPNNYYRPISKPVNVNGKASTSQPKENKEPSALKPYNKDKDVSNL